MQNRFTPTGHDICEESRQAVKNIMSKHKKIVRDENSYKFIKEKADKLDAMLSNHSYKMFVEYVDTEIVTMNVSTERLEKFEKYFKNARALNDKIMKISKKIGLADSIFYLSIEGTYVPLFIPEVTELIYDNRDLILQYFPNANNCAPQMFYADDNKIPIGLHNSVEHDLTASQMNWEQKTFHMSVRDSVSKNTAFVLYHNDLPNTVGTTKYYYDRLINKLSEDEKAIAQLVYISRYIHLLNDTDIKELINVGYTNVPQNELYPFFIRDEYCDIFDVSSNIKYQGHYALLKKERLIFLIIINYIQVHLIHLMVVLE